MFEGYLGKKQERCSGVYKKRKLQIFFILLFFLGTFVFGMENQAENDKKLKEEILAVYESEGEEGLRNFVKSRKDHITNKFISGFAESSVKERNEELLKTSLVIAEEKNDEKALADVYYNMGKYFRLISDYKKASNNFRKALQRYVKLDDLAGQGNVYWSKGNIYLYTGDYSNAFEMYDKALIFYKKVGYDLGRGKVYWRKGVICYVTGDNAKALVMYDKALLLFEKEDDSLGQGNVYQSKGDIYFYTGDNSRALEMYDKALLFYEKAEDLNGQGNAYQRKGVIYLRTGNSSKANEMYEKTLVFFEKAEDFIGQGNVYQAIGDMYGRSGNISKALEMYDKALPFYEKAGEPIGQGNVYRSKGTIYFFTGNYSRAIELFDKALLFYEKIGEPIGQGNVFMYKGDIYLNSGDNSKAFEMYDNALRFYKKGGDLLGQGNVCLSKGDVYLKTNDTLRALELFDKALDFFKKAGSPAGQGYLYLRKGDIYYRIGVNSKAHELFDKALTFFELVGDPLGQSNVYASKGDIYLRTGDTLKALEMYDQALPFYEKVGQPVGQGNVYNCKGAIYFKTGDNSKAIEMFDKALPFFEKVGEPIGQANAHRFKGDIYLRIGKCSKALEMYDKALTFYTKVGDIKGESYTLHGKAKVLAKQREKDEALDLFEKSIFKLEKMRNQTASSDMKGAFMELVYGRYEETVVFMLKKKYYERGFRFAESMKARIFLDWLAEGLVRLEKGIAPELKQKRDNLTSRLSILSKEINEAAGKNDEKKLKELKEQYRKVEGELEELLVKIRLKNPMYASVRYPEPVSLQELQKNVLKKKELLLRYFIAKDKAYVFVISKKAFNVVTLDVKPDHIDQMVKRYVASIEKGKSADMIKYGTELYRKVFKPLETLIKNKKNIIVVPDGELAKIPFESFIIHRKKSAKPVYLLEKYRLKYTQSASVLAILRKHYRREGVTNHFTGFGDPVYDYENFKKGKPEQGSPSPLKGDAVSDIFRSRYKGEGGILKRLPASGEEVKTIAGLFKNKAQKSVVYLREKANESNAKSPVLKAFDYIHFSCHGILGNGFQSLVLSQIPGSPEDGYLTLNEIMNCDYNARLVVLSACQTGKGRMEKGEGVTGLTRAVMHAGTPAVVASLWNVADVAAKELMVRFYRYMLEKKMDKNEALRKAKLDLIKSEKYASPFFWSAFVMYGE